MKGENTMRITDLLKSNAIELGVSIASKDEAIDSLLHSTKRRVTLRIPRNSRRTF